MMAAIVNLVDKCYFVKDGKWMEVPIGSKLSDYAKVDPKPASPIHLPIEHLVESSKPGKFYTVTNNNGSVSCECRGYMYRGKCKHADSIRASIKQRVL